MWTKLHVPNICSGHNMVKFTQAVSSDIVVLCFLKKSHLSHCYIDKYEDKHVVPLALAGIR